LSEQDKRKPSIIIGFKTTNSDGYFDALEEDANLLDIPPGSIDVAKYTFHVTGDIYEAPKIARRNHRCAGSINLFIPLLNGKSYETSHVFYLDETMHDGVVHWNHEIWARNNETDFKMLPKDKTKYHKIPDSDFIELSAHDDKGRKDSKIVKKPSK